MEVRFDNDSLDRLETDLRYTGGWPQSTVTAFRRQMQQIRATKDEQEFYKLKSLNSKIAAAKISKQRSMRLNDQYRLIFEFDSQSSREFVRIVSIEDYD